MDDCNQPQNEAQGCCADRTGTPVERTLPAVLRTLQAYASDTPAATHDGACYGSGMPIRSFLATVPRSAHHRRLGAFAITAASGLLWLAGPVPSASATGFRCGRRHVDRGDPSTKVEKLCGSPQHRRERDSERTARKTVWVRCGPSQTARCAQTIEERVRVRQEVWTYDLGPKKLVRYLTFEEGVLLRIETGDYGER